MSVEDENRTDVVVRQTRKKDGEAFACLMAQHGRHFRWYFIFHRIPNGDAEDLAVELIEEIVLTKIDQFEGNDNDFRKWLAVLLKHKAATWHRQQRLRFEPLLEQLGFDKWHPPAAADPGEAVTEETKRLRSALDKMRPADRELLMMRYFDGFVSHAEVAEALGVEPGTVRVRMHRALLRLRELMDVRDKENR